jgi:hypothetical protein
VKGPWIVKRGYEHQSKILIRLRCAPDLLNGNTATQGPDQLAKLTIPSTDKPFLSPSVIYLISSIDSPEWMHQYFGLPSFYIIS